MPTAPSVGLHLEAPQIEVLDVLLRACKVQISTTAMSITSGSLAHLRTRAAQALTRRMDAQLTSGTTMQGFL